MNKRFKIGDYVKIKSPKSKDVSINLITSVDGEKYTLDDCFYIKFDEEGYEITKVRVKDVPPANYNLLWVWCRLRDCAEKMRYPPKYDKKLYSMSQDEYLEEWKKLRKDVNKLIAKYQLR